VRRRAFLSLLSSGLWTRRAPGQGSPQLKVDRHGLIVQTDGDGGDTAQREGWAWFGAWIREHELHNPWPIRRSITFQEAMGFLEVGQTGIFRRHPDQHSQPQDFSRDQTIPIVAAMGVWGDTARLERLWNRTAARNYHAQNGDLFLPEIVNLFERARGVQPGPIGDLQLAGSVLARNSQAANRDNVGDDLNLVVQLLMAALRFPSAGSGIPGTSTADVMKMYAKGRPLSYGSYLQSYREKLKSMLGYGNLTANP
jgi:hypothetical protein